jgi:hypothetical protein
MTARVLCCADAALRLPWQQQQQQQPAMPCSSNGATARTVMGGGATCWPTSGFAAPAEDLPIQL